MKFQYCREHQKILSKSSEELRRFSNEVNIRKVLKKFIKNFDEEKLKKTFPYLSEEHFLVLLKYVKENAERYKLTKRLT